MLENTICGFQLWKILWAAFTNFLIAFMIFFIIERDNKKRFKYAILCGIVCALVDFDHGLYYHVNGSLPHWLTMIAVKTFRTGIRFLHLPVTIIALILYCILPKSMKVRIFSIGIFIHISIDLLFDPLVNYLIGIHIG